MLRILRQRWLRDGLATIAVVVSAAALVAAPEQAMEGAKNGLALCFNVIVPSLFPFFVLSSLVVDLGLAAWLGRALEGIMRPLFRVSGSLRRRRWCWASSAATRWGPAPPCSLYQQGLCSKVEAERLLAFCNNSGPAFIFGVVGAGVFGRRSGGFAALPHPHPGLPAGGAAVPVSRRGEARRLPRRPPDQAHPHRHRARRLHLGGHPVLPVHPEHLRLCGILLRGASAARPPGACCPPWRRCWGCWGLSEEWAHRLVAGLLELSSGVSSLTGGSGLAGRASMAAFMLGWAGLSVHCQVLSFLIDSGLSARVYLAGKLCHGLLAAGLTWLATLLFPISQSVSHYLLEQTESIAALDFSTALAISTCAAFGCWLAFTALCAALAGKRCGKRPGNRVY